MTLMNGKQVEYGNKIFRERQSGRACCSPVYVRERKRTEPNRTETVRFGSNRSEPNSNRLFEIQSNRTEPNSNRLFENSVEPNRTRTDFFKVKSNRTELEPYLKKIESI